MLNSEEGVLYYNSKIDEKALELTNNKHIQVIYFDFMKETIRNVLNTFEQVLPDKDVIGDPFWMLMNTDGNYFVYGEHNAYSSKLETYAQLAYNNLIEEEKRRNELFTLLPANSKSHL